MLQRTDVIVIGGGLAALSAAISARRAGALARKESRGAHFRSDYPETDEAFRGSWFTEKEGGSLKTFFRPCPGR